MSATMTARRAAHSDSMSVVARWGLAARATIYLLIGVLAVAVAVGSPRGEADQRGALQALVHHRGGAMMVWVIAVGLAGYALWRLSEAAFGVAGEGRKAGPRGQSLARGLIYLFFALNAFKIVTHSSSGSQADQQELWTAKAMRHPGGRWAVGIVGAVVVVCGAVLVWQGLTRAFEKHLRMGQMSPGTRTAVRALGTVGTAARGAVFALAGVLVMLAALRYRPRDAGGLDVALQRLDNTPAGPALLIAAGIGLIAFGVYGYAEAKWHRL